MQQNLSGKLAGFCRSCLCFWKLRASDGGTCMRDGSKSHAGWSCGMHSDIHDTEVKDMSPKNKERFK